MRAYELFRLPIRAASLAGWCLLVGLLVPEVARANFGHAQSSSGWAIDWSHNRMGPTAQWVPANTPSNGSTGWAISGGTLSGHGKGAIPHGRGFIDVQAKVVPTRPSVASALGRFARKAIPVLATGNALYDLFRELNYDPSVVDGELVLSRQENDFTFTYTCQYGAWSGEDACHAAWIAAMRQAGFSTCTSPGWTWGGNNFYQGQPYANGLLPIPGSGCPNYSSIGSRNATSYGLQTKPKTLTDFENEVAAKTNWGTSSALPRAIKEAIDSGETVYAPAPTVTGPASAPGSSSTTTSGNTTTTRNETHNYTYSGNTINYTTTVITTINNNGTVTTEETTSQGESDPSDCERSPTAAGCQETDVPGDEVPKSEKNVTWAAEDLGLGSGTCPQPVSWNDILGTHTLDLSGYCSMLSTIVRPVVIAMALLAAFFIVAPVRQGDT